MGDIHSVTAREILDSRGNPTIEADIYLDNGIMGRGVAPAGASKGTYEALELRDGDPKRYQGRGVLNAVMGVKEKIAPALKGMNIHQREEIDRHLCALDGTENKRHLGANAILAVSLAVADAGARACDMPLFLYLGGEAACLLPTPMINVINGGAHADNPLDIQEFMILPVQAACFRDALEMSVGVFHRLKESLLRDGHNTGLGDEGGFAPDFRSTTEALDALLAVIKQCGLESVMALGLDCAATEFFQSGYYHLRGENKKLSSQEMVEWLSGLVQDYPILSIEDGMAEDDWEGWGMLTQKLGKKCRLVGDDIFVTNKTRLLTGIDRAIANSILIKPNQIGTLYETFETIQCAYKHNYACILSHRSGETEDAMLADIAVSAGSGQIKTGSVARSERVAKYNRLLRIEEILGSRAKYGDVHLKNIF